MKTQGVMLTLLEVRALLGGTSRLGKGVWPLSWPHPHYWTVSGTPCVSALLCLCGEA